MLNDRNMWFIYTISRSQKDNVDRRVGLKFTAQGVIKKCIFQRSSDVLPSGSFAVEPFVERTILQRNKKFSRITGRRRSITGGYAPMINHLFVANSFTKFRAAALRRRFAGGEEGDCTGRTLSLGVSGPEL